MVRFQSPAWLFTVKRKCMSGSSCHRNGISVNTVSLILTQLNGLTLHYRPPLTFHGWFHNKNAPPQPMLTKDVSETKLSYQITNWYRRGSVSILSMEPSAFALSIGTNADYAIVDHPSLVDRSGSSTAFPYMAVIVSTARLTYPKSELSFRGALCDRLAFHFHPAGKLEFSLTGDSASSFASSSTTDRSHSLPSR